MGIRDHILESEKTDRNFGEVMEQMTGAEIARAITRQEGLKKPLSRQAVSNTLKRGMKKMFMALKKENKDWNAFDVAVAMSVGLNVDEVEMAKFFKLFPPDVRAMIEADAAKSMTHLKK